MPAKEGPESGLQLCRRLKSGSELQGTGAKAQRGGGTTENGVPGLRAPDVPPHKARKGEQAEGGCVLHQDLPDFSTNNREGDWNTKGHDSKIAA